MAKNIKPTLEEGTVLYVVDYWATTDGPRAFATKADVTAINNEARTFEAVLYGEVYQTYTFDDLGFIVFDSAQEAAAAAKKLPLPKTEIFLIKNGKVLRRIVEGVMEDTSKETLELVVCLNAGEDVPISELGKTLFTKKEDAVKKCNSIKKNNK